MTAGAGPRGAWGVVGGEEAVLVLERMLEAERVPHALLITGPPEVGKRRIALGLAQALNCDPEAEDGARPCGECRPCQRIAAGRHADVEVVGPSAWCRVTDHDHSRSRVIGICQVRRLELAAVTQPYEGRRRVFIIDPADGMTAAAADAFLKTLEEPPPAVTFVLVSSRPGLLPETVRSRCRALAVAPLPVAALAEWLEDDRGLPSSEAQTLARMAHGRLGWAVTALHEGEPLALRHAQIEEIERLAAAGRAERFAYAERLGLPRGGEPVNALTALAHWTDWWRDLLLVGAGCGDRVTHADQGEALAAAAGRYRPADISRFLLALSRCTKQLRQGVNARLALDALLTQIPVVASPAAALPAAATAGAPA